MCQCSFGNRGLIVSSSSSHLVFILFFSTAGRAISRRWQMQQFFRLVDTNTLEINKAEGYNLDVINNLIPKVILFHNANAT